MPSDLFLKQTAFSRMLVRLLQKAHDLGYEVTLGEAYRPPEQAAANAAKGVGIRNSLHILRLAVDLNLFRDGQYLSSTESHRPLGEYWESIGGSWGGRFSKPDGNHYSLEYNGVR